MLTSCPSYARRTTTCSEIFTVCLSYFSQKACIRACSRPKFSFRYSELTANLQAFARRWRTFFSQYRKKLFEAIMQDPVRWLNLSILLESSSIYTEAFVHLAGSLNSFLRTNTKSNIPPVVLAQLKRKDEKLKSAKEMVVGELSRLTVHVDGKPVKMGGSLETWITVQLFRDWLAVELDKIERQGADSSRRLSGDRVSGNSGTVPYGIGTLLRRIYRGGDAYLAYDKVIKEIKETFEFLGSDWEDLADDLRALKDYASRTVKKICSNNLMIDPESHKIPYLTCVDVAPNEFPWMLLAEGT